MAHWISVVLPLVAWDLYRGLGLRKTGAFGTRSLTDSSEPEHAGKEQWSWTVVPTFKCNRVIIGRRACTDQWAINGLSPSNK
jgi:hypothetical protein